jgi:uncharacterized protein YhhL (DUF1145 family)
MCANQKNLLAGDFAFLIRLCMWAAALAAINLSFSMKGKITVEIKTKFLTAMRLCSIMLLTSFVVASAIAQTSDTIIPPLVPPEIQVPAGNELFFVGRGVGTQNYVCLPCDPSQPGCASGVAFALFTPQATLFNNQGEQVTTHFFSPNPSEGGVVRATWQHSRDTSAVFGRVIGSSSDPKFVTPGAIPWLLVEVVGAQVGPTGGAKLTRTTFIQRLNTVGGAAPSKGCNSSADVGAKAFVPYTSDYLFYSRQ